MTTKTLKKHRIDFTPRPSDYIVPATRAANIRQAMNAMSIHIPQGTPVRFAKRSREVPIGDSALKKAVRNDPVRCIEGQQCKDAGTPAVICAREIWCLEPRRSGKKEIVVYAKDDRATDKFDRGGKKFHRFLMRKWPDSWFPRYRAALAQDQAKREKNGGPIVRRKYNKTGSAYKRPLRISATELLAKYA